MSILLTTCGRAAARLGRTSRRLRPELVALEPRCLLASGLGVEPTAIEQYMLQVVNRARSAPTEEASRLATLARSDPSLRAAISDLELAAFLGEMSRHGPVAPLTFNPRLIESSRVHDSRMLHANAQFHSDLRSLVAPISPDQAARDGLPYLDVGPRSWTAAENVFAYSSNLPDAHGKPLVDYFHAAFLLDWGNPNFGHLRNLLAPGPADASATNFRVSEIGIGIITDVRPTVPAGAAAISANQNLDVGPALVTQQFAWRSGLQFLTGAAFADRDFDRFYSPGEGMGSIIVQAIGRKGEGSFTTSTWGSGGYSLALPMGTFDVTMSGPGLSQAQQRTVTMSAANVEWNVVETPSAPVTPVVTISPSPPVSGNGPEKDPSTRRPETPRSRRRATNRRRIMVARRALLLKQKSSGQRPAQVASHAPRTASIVDPF